MAVDDTFGPLVPNATNAWLKLLSDVVRTGQRVYVRGSWTTELLHRGCIIDMKHPIVNVKNRKLGAAFLFGEAAWILSGRNDVTSIQPFSKRISDFSDDGIFFRGAYGPQIIQQLPYILECFTDIYTRQAVISIWKPSPPNSKDIPCTIDVHFMVRGGLLHTFVHMRSSDCWLGVPYDWFNFSMLSYWVMLMINERRSEHGALDLGFLHFCANSQHIYDTNMPDVLPMTDEFTVLDLDPKLCDLEDEIFKCTTATDFRNHLWSLAYAQLDSNTGIAQ